MSKPARIEKELFDLMTDAPNPEQEQAELSAVVAQQTLIDLIGVLVHTGQNSCYTQLKDDAMMGALNTALSELRSEMATPEFQAALRLTVSNRPQQLHNTR
jgi:hypothetical protein